MNEQPKRARSAPKVVKRGKFITLEGGEGSGKTTLSHRLQKDINRYLKSSERECLLMREPGGLYGDKDSVCDRLRSILRYPPKYELLGDEAELFLFVAAQSQSIFRIIEPALAKGDWVICDRFCDSTLCYQGYGRRQKKGHFNLVKSCWKRVLERQTPDLTLLLDLDPALGLQRTRRVNVQADRIEAEALGFHQQVRRGYKILWAKYPDRIKLINAIQDLQEVNKTALDLIRERLFEGDR